MPLFILLVDEYITKKQLAAVRFHRNHRLMLEIFSDSKIPDTRSVVTNSRLVVLRKQVNSLLLHQVGLPLQCVLPRVFYTGGP